MQYHSILHSSEQLASLAASLPERALALCTRFPIEDFVKKRSVADDHQKMDVLPMLELDWYRFEEHHEVVLLQKRELLSNYRDLTYCTLNANEPAGYEALERSLLYLCDKFPARFQAEQGGVRHSATGEFVDLARETPDPLLRLAALVDEDIVLLSRAPDGKYRVSAVCACFPSHWSIHSKLGQSLREVHAPVPNLNRLIGDKIDALAEALQPNRPVERINILVNFDPRWSQFPALVAARPFAPVGLEPDNVGNVLYLRNERETIVKLPASDSLLFTIKTYQTIFRELPPSVCGMLAQFHENFDPKYRDTYRKLDSREQGVVIEWLKVRANSPTP